MSVTVELLRDLGLLERIITAVEAAKTATPGTELAVIKGVHIAGKKLTITLTAE